MGTRNRILSFELNVGLFDIRKASGIRMSTDTSITNL